MEYISSNVAAAPRCSIAAMRCYRLFFCTLKRYGDKCRWEMVEYCEKNDPVRGMHQPINSITGLVFLVTALKLSQGGRHEYGGMLIALAISTFGVHASDNKDDFWKRADMASMWAIVLTSLLHNLGAHASIPYIVAAAVMLSMCTNALKLPPFIAVCAVWVLSFLPRCDPCIVAGYACFAIAFACWLLDVNGRCHPRSLLQLHALWHLGSAAGFYFLLLRSKQVPAARAV